MTSHQKNNLSSALVTRNALNFTKLKLPQRSMLEVWEWGALLAHIFWAWPIVTNFWDGIKTRINMIQRIHLNWKQIASIYWVCDLVCKYHHIKGDGYIELYSLQDIKFCYIGQVNPPQDTWAGIMNCRTWLQRKGSHTMIAKPRKISIHLESFLVLIDYRRLGWEVGIKSTLPLLVSLPWPAPLWFP